MGDDRAGGDAVTLPRPMTVPPCCEWCGERVEKSLLVLMHGDWVCPDCCASVPEVQP